MATAQFNNYVEIASRGANDVGIPQSTATTKETSIRSITITGKEVY